MAENEHDWKYTVGQIRMKSNVVIDALLENKTKLLSDMLGPHFPKVCF